MSRKARPVVDWTDQEIELIVADYFLMLNEELQGRRPNKLQHNKALQLQIGRSKGSIEFKHQNISAVLDWLGEPWIEGYKPRSNYQGALIDAIERVIGARANPVAVETIRHNETSTHIAFEEAPRLAPNGRTVPEPLRRLIGKFDPALRDAQNRTLGKNGEERLFHAEIARLRSVGRHDLASKVVWTSQELGDGVGYDIHSYAADGSDRLLEAKTTLGHKTTPFYLTHNERCVSEERPDAYRIVRIYDFARNARAFELVPPLEEQLALQPTVYRATFH